MSLLSINVRKLIRHLMKRCWSSAAALLFALLVLPGIVSAADKKIVLIAGSPSHGPGEHEHRAGCLLLKSGLDQVPGVTSVVYSNGWPDSPEAFAGAAAIVVYSDGGSGHPLLQGDRLKTIGALMDQGVGLACIHYAVEPTKEKGETEFLEWIGGAFEIHWSVNPHWDAEFTAVPHASHHPGRKAVHDEGRVVFQYALSGRNERRDADPDRGAAGEHGGPRRSGRTLGIPPCGPPLNVVNRSM